MLLNGATNLTSIVFPESLRTIADSAFTNSKLMNISFGSKVSNINSRCNANGNSIGVSIDEENMYYKSIDNVIYSKDGKKLICVMSSINGGFVLDDSVEEIGDSAFIGQRNMTSIKLNIRIKNIGKNAFENCTNLKNIWIPSSIEKIGLNAFVNTTNLKEIIINKNKNSINGSPWGNQYGEKAVSWNS